MLEFKRLTTKKKKLETYIKESYKAQNTIRKVYKAALIKLKIYYT